MTIPRDSRSLRPVAPTIRRRIVSLLARSIDSWVATVIAHREREAARVALRHLNDRESKGIGIRRRQIGGGLAEIAEGQEFSPIRALDC
jgi:uncharacterized protein YjiS (DUF1127 family)